MKKLAVFDVDGTLTDTTLVDSRCFAQAIEEEFGIRNFNRRWSTYSEFTDSAILLEIFDEAFAREPTPGEVMGLVDRFVGVLERAQREDPTRFRAIQGAPELVRTLADDEAWSFAVATGGWERSARLKLGYAGIEIGDAVLSSAEASTSRTEIVERAILRSGVQDAHFGHVVIVGDTVRDLEVASVLGLPFLGVARGDGATTLAENGARSIVGDFGDADGVVELLSRAEPPRRPN